MVALEVSITTLIDILNLTSRFGETKTRASILVSFQEAKQRSAVASVRFHLVQLRVVICAGRIDHSRQAENGRADESYTRPAVFMSERPLQA